MKVSLASLRFPTEVSGLRGSRHRKPKGALQGVSTQAVASHACNVSFLPVLRYSGCRRRTQRLLSSKQEEPSVGQDQAADVPAELQNESVDWLNTSLLFLFPALCGLLFGYDIGATSGALVSLKSAATSGTEWGPALSSLQSGAVVSSSLAGALVGSASTFFLVDKLGRRDELLLSTLLYGGASSLMAASPTLAALIVGHSLYGIGIGFAMHAAPAYIAETAPVSVRGLLVSLKECFIVGGILLGYLAGSVFIEDAGGWRYMLAGAAPIAAIAGLGMLRLPESPRWLLLSGARKAEAEGCLARTLGAKATAGRVGRELQAMRDGLAKAGAEQLSGEKLQQLFTRRSYRQPLLIGMSLMLFQQITGQPSVLYYAAEIFKNAGFEAASDATKVSVVLGFFKVAVTAVATVKVDSWGRRPLLLGGVAGIIGSLMLLSAASFGYTGDSSASASVAALLLYVGAYQLSFGPISWLIVGEVFPLAVRGQALALATLTNFGSNFAVSLFLPYAEETLGLGGLYLTFGAIGIVALATIYFTVPETRGKTLEEIEALWAPADSKQS